jgi:hypothetical protein
MKVLHTIACAGALLAGIAGAARADDTPTDPAAYKQKLHDCQTQMKTDHPDMNHEARHKACRKQLGPMPKAPKAAPAASSPTTSP